MIETLLAGPVLAIGAALFWSIAVILFKVAGEETPPLALNLAKNVVALVFFLPLIPLAGESLWPECTGREWAVIAVSGVIGITVADTLFFAALNRLGAGLQAVVDCFYAPSMILMSVVWLGEPLTAGILLGAGLVATAVLIGSASRPIEGRSRRDLVTGFALGALGIVLLGVCIGILKPIFRADESRVVWIAAVRLAAATLALVPLVLLGPDRRAFLRIARPGPAWKVVVPAGFFGGTLAMACWIGGIEKFEVSANAILNQLSTIFIFLFAAVLLKEPLTRRRILAVALAFAGAVLTLA